MLIVECFLDGNNLWDDEGNRIQDEDFSLNILKIFINNGLDINRYVNHIFRVIQFTYSENNYVEMTKLVLNNLTDKNVLDLETSLTGIGNEESYNNCCEVNHKYANVLSTIYEMIDGFSKGNDENKYFNCDKIIGQKVNDIKIYNEDLKIDLSNKLITNNIDLLLECENDTLTILNKYIFINNNEFTSNYEELYSKNRFLTNLKKIIIGETVTNIAFENEKISSKHQVEYNITKIIVSFSNNKKLIINMDESITNMKLVLV